MADVLELVRVLLLGVFIVVVGFLSLTLLSLILLFVTCGFRGC